MRQYLQIFHSPKTYDAFPQVIKRLAATLEEFVRSRECCCVLMGLLQTGTFFAERSFPHCINTLLVWQETTCGCSPSLVWRRAEATMWHRILVWCCHRGIGRQVCGVRLRAIDDGNGNLCSDKFQHVDQLHRASILWAAALIQAAAFARVREHAVRFGAPRYCGTGFVFFCYRNVGTVKSRSCSSPVFCGMWNKFVHLCRVSWSIILI